MLKLKSILLAAVCAMALVGCDSDTYTIGGSLISNLDDLSISSNTFQLSTRSIMAEPVVARTTMSYLGTVKDPETGDYITANYMSQFHTLEDYELPDEKLIKSRDEEGNVIADECELRLFYTGYYGDSLSTMKLTAYELDHPMREDEQYYSDFDPKAAGFVREGGLKVNHAYTLADMNIDLSYRLSTEYSPNLCITLNKPYTDKNGTTYNNFGTYVMRKYYENPSNFKNSVKLTHNVLPGFYIESSGGLGSMANITLCQLNINFRYGEENKDTTKIGLSSFAGTQEVMQYTRYISDSDKLRQLAEDQTCTYLKTPTGIYTEITFPVDDILRGHDNDTINSAKFSLQRLNSKVEDGLAFKPASTILLIPADSLKSFFENRNIVNYKTSYIANYDSSTATYVFNNVSSLVKAMDNARRAGNASANWNKGVLVPVNVNTSTDGTIARIVHDMSLTSTRLVGGAQSPHAPITLSVIYSKYQ